MTLHGDVGSHGLDGGTEMAASGSIWSHATQIAAGRFNAATYVTDLMVRWSSGALNNHVGTTTGGLGSEQPIHGPDKTWTHSVIMTTGQYTGDGLTNDLIIRWNDGETTLYKDTRLGSEIMIAPPAQAARQVRP
ncbi:hypothetical protein Snoj_15540 [Streptomyces nojiriensis]|uniref:ASPIC/UnbV domain-containing protein n=1 Tax=Streptomyces nojiriensis TaxID=66374 RepID=A0ABQ3SHN8_9ACTN|nr:hypothetical protein [Streptomyces nojiriensis]QTI49263.1 hypothetical protein JYK04_07134 [Streptomyces nojiriensis]GGS10189.1 hypothetical protein GCM10010205_44480 [Streptomyces nojiriensis]GHI67636.1 hypothetical protein Snoj_15540 [Streptomyces nojiriensis]